jgi:hypothetical protein
MAVIVDFRWDFGGGVNEANYCVTRENRILDLGGLAGEQW